MTSAGRLRAASQARVVHEEYRLAIEDCAGVLQSPDGKVRNRHLIEFRDRMVDGEISLK